MDGEGPYRSQERIARFVCIVCYKSLSTHGGECGACGVPRLDLSEPAVREQVRLEAEKRLQASMYREYSALALTSGLLVAPSMWWLGSLAFVLVPPVTMVVARAYAALRRNSAIATFAARRRRISAELGVDVQIDDAPHSTTDARDFPRLEDDAIAGTSDLDPLQLEIAPLLAWLGAKLDD